MQHNHFSRDQNQKTLDALRAPAVASDVSDNSFNSTGSSVDEVARRAYFSYLNEGSRPGRDVQHWLDAEAEVLEERDLTRVHGFHNQT
jgi:hypothetical protein